MALRTPHDQTDNLHDEPDVEPVFSGDEGLNNGAVYDDQTTPSGDSSDPRGKDNVAAGKSSDPRSEGLTPEQLSDKESGGLPESGEADTSEKNILYSGSGKSSSSLGGKIRQKFTAKNARRRLTIGVIASLLGLGGIGGFSVLQGPLKAMHLAETLGLPGRSQNDLNSRRMYGIYRYARTGEIGETRISKIQSIIHKNVSADFEKQGITLNNEGSRGRLASVTIEPSINEQLKDLSVDERRKVVASTFGVDESDVKVYGNGNLEVSANGKRYSFKKNMITQSFGLAGKGRISTAMNNRVFRSFFGEYSFFHPMKKIEEKYAQTIDDRLAARRAKREAVNKENEKATKLQEKYQKFFNEGREKTGMGGGFKAAAGGALMLAGGLCVVKDISETMPKLQFAASVLPTMQAAQKFEGLGSQVKSGDDFTISQLGDELSPLIDNNGKDVFTAKSLNALAGQTKGEDLDQSIQESFSPENKFASLNSALDNTVTDAMCSDIGQIAQGVGGIALVFLTAGTGTVVVQTISGAVQGQVISMLVGYLEKLYVGPGLAKLAMSGGPMGGNLLAHGAMAKAGLTSMNFGGVAFSKATSQEIREQRIAEYNDEFSKQSFVVKTLDINDRRSLAGNLIDSTPNNSSQILASLTNVFNIKSIFSSIGSFFNTRALAAERSYDWKMPEYGFSKTILDNPDYQDPYENADKVAGAINDSYVDRAEKCFGAKISKDDEDKWGIITDSMPNPAEGEYKDANCGDESDENWIRLRLFILDSKNIFADVCMRGDPEDPEVQKTCQDMGVDTETTTGENTNTASTDSNQDSSVEPPDDINGRKLSDTEKANLKYIKENVLSQLGGDGDAQATTAARAAWWALHEMVLNLKQPSVFSYSNCGSGDGNTPIGITDSCSAPTWQVGIGAVQVPNYSDSQVESMAKERHPGKTIKEILDEYAQLTGNSSGAAYNTIINSTGKARRSNLLRDPATGISMVANNEVKNECIIPSPKSWCVRETPIAKNLESINKSIEELKQYFLSVNTSQPGGNTDAESTINLNDIYNSSENIKCASGTKDLGVQDGYRNNTKVKTRLCAIQNVSETGDVSDVPGANGKLVVSSKVSGVVIRMVQDAKNSGISPITAAEGFRSMARQTHLYNCKPGCGIGSNPVASPGTSNHQLGLAIDWNEPMRGWMVKNGDKYGYKWYGQNDAPHFSPDGR